MYFKGNSPNLLETKPNLFRWRHSLQQSKHKVSKYLPKFYLETKNLFRKLYCLIPSHSAWITWDSVLDPLNSCQEYINQTNLFNVRASHKTVENSTGTKSFQFPCKFVSGFDKVFNNWNLLKFALRNVLHSGVNSTFNI